MNDISGKSSDHNVVTSTANRYHPLKGSLALPLPFSVYLLLVQNMGIVMLYQSLYLISTQFTHCNIKLPKKLNLYLSYLIVSPDMHKTYHHYRHPLTDANYGTSFSLWDRLLGNYLSFDKKNLI